MCAVTCTLFLTTTVIAMWRYGSTVSPNLLQGMPSTAPLYADIMLVTLQICLSMVVGGCALYQNVEDKLGVPRGKSLFILLFKERREQ